MRDNAFGNRFGVRPPVRGDRDGLRHPDPAAGGDNFIDYGDDVGIRRYGMFAAECSIPAVGMCVSADYQVDVGFDALHRLLALGTSSTTTRSASGSALSLARASATSLERVVLLRAIALRTIADMSHYLWRMTPNRMDYLFMGTEQLPEVVVKTLYSEAEAFDFRSLALGMLSVFGAGDGSTLPRLDAYSESLRASLCVYQGQQGDFVQRVFPPMVAQSIVGTFVGNHGILSSEATRQLREALDAVHPRADCLQALGKQFSMTQRGVMSALEAGAYAMGLKVIYEYQHMTGATGNLSVDIVRHRYTHDPPVWPSMYLPDMPNSVVPMATIQEHAWEADKVRVVGFERTHTDISQSRLRMGSGGMFDPALGGEEGRFNPAGMLPTHIRVGLSRVGHVIRAQREVISDLTDWDPDGDLPEVGADHASYLLAQTIRSALVASTSLCEKYGILSLTRSLAAAPMGAQNHRYSSLLVSEF